MKATQPPLPDFPHPSPCYPFPRLRDLPLRERPAYRVGHAGAGACALHELLAAVIGGPQQVGIAVALLAQYGSLAELSTIGVQELAQWEGLGPAKAAALHAALELGRRMQVEALDDKPQVRSPADAAALLMPEIGHLAQEHLVVLLLDTRNRVVGKQVVYKGNLNSTHIRAAEVFREAVRRNCAAILVAHNHPSQDVSPSPEDATANKALVLAGRALDIELVDHLIVSRQAFVSLRERGLGWTD
jgi:DNA repair protein RadC